MTPEQSTESVRVFLENPPDSGWLQWGIAVLGVVAAFVAAWYAKRSADAAREANSAAARGAYMDLLLRFTDDYHTPEMGDALRRLRTLRPSFRDAFDAQAALNSINARASGEDGTPEQQAESRQMLDAIRRVKMYYFRAARAIEAGDPEAKAGRDACFNWGVELFFNIVQPIEKARRGEREPFEVIRKAIAATPEKLTPYGVDATKQLRAWDTCEQGGT